ncbi:MAG: phage antirepressor N-terminal domain-containing protein [Enterobacteriaceae bacterium]
MKTIATINNIEITTATNSETLVPIKPICTALGIDYPSQYTKIINDEILASSFVMRPTVAEDGKTREMLCLPFYYVYGWLMTINPKNVNEQSKGAVVKYKLECYEAINKHFYIKQQKQIKSNEEEIQLLNLIQEDTMIRKEVDTRIHKNKKRLNLVRENRLKDDPSLF